MKITLKHTLLLLLSFSLLTACQDKVETITDRIIDDKAIADESQTADWMSYGRTSSERRFSPLADVNVSNVADLKVDWFLD